MSQKSSIWLGVTALVCSRGVFAFFDDPEGPNLLVVVVGAVVVYVISLTLYTYGSFVRGGLRRFTLLPSFSHKELFSVMGIEVLVTTALYFCLG